MPPEFLTTAEFLRWADQFDKKLDEIKELRDDVQKNTIDIALLQQQQTKAKGINGTISAVVSGIIAAVIAYGSAK